MTTLILSEEEIIYMIKGCGNDIMGQELKAYLLSILWSLGYKPNSKEEEYFYKIWVSLSSQDKTSQ